MIIYLSVFIMLSHYNNKVIDPYILLNIYKKYIKIIYIINVSIQYLLFFLLHTIIVSLQDTRQNINLFYIDFPIDP